MKVGKGLVYSVQLCIGNYSLYDAVSGDKPPMAATVVSILWLYL